MATLNDFLSASVVKGNLRQQPSDIETQFFTLAELRIEKDIAKFSDCTGGQLGVTSVNVGQITECASNLNENHSFALG